MPIERRGPCGPVLRTDTDSLKPLQRAPAPPHSQRACSAARQMASRLGVVGARRRALAGGRHGPRRCAREHHERDHGALECRFARNRSRPALRRRRPARRVSAQALGGPWDSARSCIRGCASRPPRTACAARGPVAATPPSRRSRPPARRSPERRPIFSRPTTSRICRRPRGTGTTIAIVDAFDDSARRVGPRRLPRQVRTAAVHHRTTAASASTTRTAAPAKGTESPDERRPGLGARDLARSGRGVGALPELPHRADRSEQRPGHRPWRRHRGWPDSSARA